MWMNSSQTSNNIQSVGRWTDGHIPNNPAFRSFGSSAGSLALSTQQRALITGLKNRNDMNEKQAQPSGHRALSRTTSCGVYHGGNGAAPRPSALNQHRALQRSTSYEINRVPSTMPAGIGSRSSGLPPATNSNGAGGNTSSNGFRSRETGVVEKLLVSYGFIKCADREGRLFFHYSQFHGEANVLSINDEVEFDVSMDSRTGKPVAIQVVKLKKGTVVFEVYSDERILGEITSPAAQNASASPVSPSSSATSIGSVKSGEKGEPFSSGKYGSLCYDRNGEVFFLPYSVNDLTNKSVQLQVGDKVSFYIATEKRTGILRARKITLVERAPPKRFIGIVTAMKESFGFIERADVVKEIFFHYSEVSNNVPDLHIGDHVEFCIQDRNNKEVATNVRLLPPGTVQLEEFSSDVFIGTVEKPLPPKAPNRPPQQPQISNAAGDAAVVSKVNGNAVLQAQQPSVTLAGVIQYSVLGESRKIRFGEKDRAANCSYTLCQGDKVSFFTVTDRRNGQQRAAGVTLMLQETLEVSGEKRERGIVAAVKEGFGFIKCLERDSRLFFHCCELLDSISVRMSDEVEFTVLNDPVAEKHRLHATRITILPKGTVVFHTISDLKYTGVIDSLPGTSNSGVDCVISPALGANPGFISYEDTTLNETVKLPYTVREFVEWSEANSVTIGTKVQFQICTLKRTGAKNAVNIKLVDMACVIENGKRTQEVVKGIVSTLQSLDTNLTQTSLPTPALPAVNSTKGEDSDDLETSLPTLMSLTKIVKAVKEHVQPPAPYVLSSEQSDDASSIKSPHRSSMHSSLSRSPSNSPACKVKSPRAEVTSPEKQLGWISTLKDTFGFIETADHSTEIFFHFSELQDSEEKFNINTPVMYAMGVKELKPCAMLVTIAKEKDLDEEKTDPTVYEGVVTKPVKASNHILPSYQGVISYNDDDDDGEQKIKYSPLSMNDRRDLIQTGDRVNFQIATNVGTGQERAVNVSVKREIIQATVESIKGEYGFLNYDVGSDGTSSKLFFHMSEVREGADEIGIGTLVDFSVVHNQRTGKYSAINVRCLESKRQRPERLRLRSSCSEPAVLATRQPKGPNGLKGFTLKRSVSADGNGGDSNHLESVSE